MLEYAVGELSLGLRSVAAKIARKHGSIITLTLDVVITDFPIFTMENPEGVISNLQSTLALMAHDYLGHRRVVEFVSETEPSSLIGVTASRRPKLLFVPASVEVPFGNGSELVGYVSCVGVYALRPSHRAHYKGHFTSSPYTKR